jgi:hypothetical protein
VLLKRLNPQEFDAARRRPRGRLTHGAMPTVSIRCGESDDERPSFDGNSLSPLVTSTVRAASAANLIIWLSGDLVIELLN